MNSVDKTLNCIFPSGWLICRYLEHVNTLFGSLLGQDIENQLTTSLEYTVIMPYSRKMSVIWLLACWSSELV